MYLLPAGLGDDGDFALHRHFTQFVTRQAELAEHTARTTGDHATVTLARRIGIARQLLQLEPSLVTFFVGLRLVVDDRLQLSALGSELVSQLGALDVAIDEGKFCHVISPLVTEREAEGPHAARRSCRTRFRGK
ncbi:hypothetical protein G6F68_010595 [Rhizopus microsporus]|nr:hypothetical protein G6F68_010595 [Rhizopus microsporus]